MTIKHTFKSSRDNNGYGYYGYIEKETNQLVIGENWPHEGGELYRGTFADAYRILSTLKDEAPRLYNSIIKYYAEKPDETGKVSISALKPGDKFNYQGEKYMLIDMELSKFFIFKGESFCFVSSLDLETYKVLYLPKDAKVETFAPILEVSQDLFTPEQVRKMTPEEVKTNYSKILESMKYWG